MHMYNAVSGAKYPAVTYAPWTMCIKEKANIGKGEEKIG
jgi:hypothetical protein